MPSFCGSKNTKPIPAIEYLVLVLNGSDYQNVAYDFVFKTVKPLKDYQIKSRAIAEVENLIKYQPSLKKLIGKDFDVVVECL